MKYETLRTLRFSGVFAKLDRADEHMRELRCLLDAHMRRPDLIRGIISYDPVDHKIYPRYRVQGLPHKLPVGAGDVIHNLRSALDHVVWQLVLANGGTPTYRTDLPIYTTRRPIVIAGGISPTTQRLIEAEQPFNAHQWEQQSRRPLAMLQYISNVDKHRTLLRGRHGVQDLIMTAGDQRPDGRRWEGRITLGDVSDRGTAIGLEPLPGSTGEVDGSAFYQVEIEYGQEPEGNEAPYNLDDLEPTLTGLARYTRTLVGRLVATIWPDYLATRDSATHPSTSGADAAGV